MMNIMKLRDLYYVALSDKITRNENDTREIAMIFKPTTLFYKTMLEIQQPLISEASNDLGLLTKVLDMTYNHIAYAAALEINRHQFQTHGMFKSKDGMSKATIASCNLVRGQPYPFLWAIMITQHDKECPKRTWYTHIGIRQDNAETLRLFYANYYADSLYGNVQNMRAPVLRVPEYINEILCTEAFVCSTGKYIVPSYAIDLTYDDIPIFIDILNDPGRTIPVIVLACPDILDPDELNGCLMGNLIIFYTADIGLLIELNNRLMPDLSIEFDGLRIFFPIREGSDSYHPIMSIKEISEIGGRQIIKRLSKAYSRSYRSDEWRDFVTVDQIQGLRQQQMNEELKTELDATKKKLKNSEDRANRIQSELSMLKEKYSARDIQEYEEFLQICIAEKDALEAMVNDITARINSGRDFRPAYDESVLINGLELSIQAAMKGRARQRTDPAV